MKDILSSRTFGETLRTCRAQCGWSLSYVAGKTLIPERFLLALENNALNTLPGDVYTKNFLKKLATMYSIEESILMQKFNEETHAVRHTTSQQKQAVSKSTGIRNGFTPDFWRKAQIAVAAVLCFGYLGWQIYTITTPPTLDIYSPTDNYKTTDTSVVITGKTKPEAQLTINGKAIYIDEQGKFSETVYFVTGHHALTIEAHTKYSRTQVKTIQIMVMNGMGTDLLTKK
jgi:cytoskeletal protein RodZ